jgi:hypothetical protein|tara:strand:- start:382 stop:519 length:138 start_codon:yes stop_codon:yes gene_type:complete
MTPEEKKEQKAKERKELMKKFLAKGGKIEKVPPNITKEMLKRGQL